MARWWSFTEDRQWSRGSLRKNWDDTQQLSWFMEVRTEDVGAGSVRMGEMVIRGSMQGELTMSIAETM
jgi:hypothetical protein